jgi:hypothetical protein
MNVSRCLLAAVLGVLVLAGCGEESETEVEPPRESPHAVPGLPSGWSVEQNDSGGFALGIPPGWDARRKGTETVLTSADELAVVTVKPDRSNEALEADLAELADATGVQLGRQFQNYELGETRPFDHRYDAFVATATGTNGGVEQEIRVFLLRRGELATFTVIAQVNEKFGAGSYDETVDRIAGSIRSRPVGGYSARSG